MIERTLRYAVIGLVVPSLIAASARAEDAGPDAPRGTAPTASAPPSGGDSFDFNFMPQANPAEEAARKKHAEEVEKKARTRRKMLLAHQALGFVTLAVLAATCVVGQFTYLDKYGGGNDDNRALYASHAVLAIASTSLFATTGALAVAAPNPYEKSRWHFDTALVHKASMLLATLGMVAQIVLGPITASREGHLDQRDLALAHVITGYATFGFMAAGTIAYVF